MSTILEINKLVKHFGETVAVDGVSLKIQEGEIYGLLGPNGAGKSTTINVLCGVLKKDAGEITCFGKDLNKNLLEIKQDIGVVPQDIAIYEDLTAKENVKFFGSLYGLKGKFLKERVEEALGFVGLNDRMNDFPKNFSGGMKRRLNIACALAHHPKLIIMDEPTVGIDPQSRNHILNSVKQLNRLGSTIIYTTHYMEEVEALCTKIGIIDHGKLIAEGTCEELQSIVSDKKVIEIETHLFEAFDYKTIEEIKGITNVEQTDNVLSIECLKESDCISDIIHCLAENNISIINISMKGTSLESTFLTLTGRSLRD